MTSDAQTADNLAIEAAVVSSTRPALAWTNMAPVAAAMDAVAIFGWAGITGMVYYAVVYGDSARHGTDFNFGVAVALFYVAVRVLRGDYAYATYTSTDASIGRICRAWLMTFMALLATVFLLKVGSHYSRGMAFSLFVTGPLVLVIQQRLLGHWFASACRTGKLAVQRVFVVGQPAEIAAHCRSTDVGQSGLAIVGTFALGDGSDADYDARRLAVAVDRARNCAPDTILVVLPLGQHARIQMVVDSFKVVPASIQLGADLLLERYPALRTLRVGGMASLELVREPLTPVELLAKRIFDLAVAGTALVLLSPLFLAVAILIKCTSSGPVFYRQERHCYNRDRFRIYKFRTMYDQGTEPAFRQATRNDPRITPVGGWLRRTNFDELPQLLNVLFGEMSIVGPRPHAIAHDENFEQRITHYSRRHNIKPGITGWAQVNGYRGETDTDDKMRARVEHDLTYLDHWSLLFDIKIIALTVFSSKAYRNAH